MSGKKGKGKQTWFGMTLAAAVLSGCGQSPLVMPGSATMPVQGMLASKAFEFDNLSAKDKEAVKLLLALQVAGFTPITVTGTYLRLGFQFKAEGKGPDGKAMVVTGTSFPDGLARLSINGKALPQPPAALVNALTKHFWHGSLTVTGLMPAAPNSPVLALQAEVYQTYNTRIGTRWTLSAVEGTFDQAAQTLTITKSTMIKSGKDKFDL